MIRLFLSTLVLFSSISHAEIPFSRSLISGNAVVTSDSVQKIVKALIVSTLNKDYNVGDGKFGGLAIETKATEHHLKIPQDALLNEILTTLGISDYVTVQIDPIQTSINFGNDSIKISVERQSENLYSVHAHWEVKELLAESKSLKILVPKGAFDRPFIISSSPMKIALKQNTGAITADITLNARLTSEGANFEIQNFRTNLDDNRTRLKMKLGQLTVDGRPLELEIMTNGQSISTDEPTVRQEFQNFEPQLMKIVQNQLTKVIHQQFDHLSEKIEQSPPFKVAFTTAKIFEKFKIKNSVVKNLFSDISAEFVFSRLQEMKTERLYSTQIASKICVGPDCLPNIYGNSDITTADLAEIIGDDGGAILYESWVQNVVNSEPFQARVREYYRTTLKTPGVYLGSQGLKLHFNAAKNAVVGVLNLKIDIKQTPCSGIKDCIKKQLADVWENIAGSGQYVYLPVEITVYIKGVRVNEKGKRELVLTTEIPFHANGTIRNTYNYRTNVQDMNATIRGEVLASVQKEIGKSLEPVIKLPVDHPITVQGIKFNINQVGITKNKGLMVSGCIQ